MRALAPGGILLSILVLQIGCSSPADDAPVAAVPTATQQPAAQRPAAVQLESESKESPANKPPVDSQAEIQPAPAAQPPQPAPDREAAVALSRARMEKVGIAIHEYMGKAGTFAFPTAVVRGAEGQPLLSWRVLVLPYLGHADLFKQFRLDEPWDSEHNKSLVARMPDAFRSPLSRAAPGRTNYVTLRGNETPFPDDKTTGFVDMLDGISNTMMFVECSDEAAPIWTRPDDLPHDRDNPLWGLLGLHTDGFLATFGDGSVQFIPASAGAATVNAMITPSGREPLDMENLPESIQVLSASKPTPADVVDRLTRAGANLTKSADGVIVEIAFNSSPIEEKLLLELLALQGLERLQSLSLTRARLTDDGLRQILESLPHPERLTQLGLSLTLVSDEGMQHLKHCPRLSYLGLDHAKITDKGLAHLSELTELLLLDLNATRVSDAGLKHLHKLKNLGSLHVRGTRVTKRGAAQLQKVLSELQFVEL